jgi:hypothetical protein
MSGTTLTDPACTCIAHFRLNIQQVLQVIASMGAGEDILRDFEANPLPNADGTWGITSGPSTNMFVDTATHQASSINVVIGMNDASFDPNGMSSQLVTVNPGGVDGTGDVNETNGVGSASIISVPAALPAISIPDGRGGVVV